MVLALVVSDSRQSEATLGTPLHALAAARVQCCVWAYYKLAALNILICCAIFVPGLVAARGQIVAMSTVDTRVQERIG